MNKSKSPVLRILAVFCLAICLLFCGIFTASLFVRNSYWDHGSLIKLIILIGASGLAGTVLWTAGTEFKKREKEFSILMFAGSVVYFVFLFAILLGSLEITRDYVKFREYSFVPFKTIRNYWKAYKNGTIDSTSVFENIFMNLIILCPLGFIAPYFIKPMRKKWWLFTVCTLVFISIIEFLQYVTMRGFMDIDDVILNMAGAVIAYFICWNGLMKKLWKKTGIIS